MCTIVAIKREEAHCPLVVAANRDEFYSRATSGPRRITDPLVRGPTILAGIDLLKGGTWMGANENGLFVGLTNQRQHEGADSAKASRGDVVMDALAMSEVAHIDAFLMDIDARAYNGFNLLYGDATELRVAYARADREAIEIQRLGEGVWVLSNDTIGSADFPKTDRVRALVEPLAQTEFEGLTAGLARALADHTQPGIESVPPPPPGSLFTHPILRALQSICVHTPVYGTRSATMLARRPGGVHYYGYADGPPCETAFQDKTELLR